MTRDPRKNPRPGDRLRRSGVEVTVLRAEGGTFSYRVEKNSKVGELPPLTEWFKDWRVPWRRWAKDAEVLHVAG